jgi:hypothetical protein
MFNAGKYQATATNKEMTNWSVVSFDGKELFTIENKKVGEVANLLMRKTMGLK